MAEFYHEVTNLREGRGNALAFFNINVGFKDRNGNKVAVLTIKDNVLRKKRDGGLFYQGPSKLRMRNGQPVKENGYDVYDELAMPYAEKNEQSGKYGLTKASNAWRESVIQQAKALLDAVEAENRGRGEERRTNAPHNAMAGVAESQGGDVNALFGGDDDDLPF